MGVVVVVMGAVLVAASVLGFVPAAGGAAQSAITWRQVRSRRIRRNGKSESVVSLLRYPAEDR